MNELWTTRKATCTRWRAPSPREEHDQHFWEWYI